LEPISTTAPTNIIKTLMNQEQATPMLCILRKRELGGTSRRWQSTALILNLPNQPMGRENTSYAQLFLGIFRIAMQHSIDQRFV
jgi:hypothetical protein